MNLWWTGSSNILCAQSVLASVWQFTVVSSQDVCVLTCAVITHHRALMPDTVRDLWWHCKQSLEPTAATPLQCCVLCVFFHCPHPATAVLLFSPSFFLYFSLVNNEWVVKAPRLSSLHRSHTQPLSRYLLFVPGFRLFPLCRVPARSFTCNLIIFSEVADGETARPLACLALTLWDEVKQKWHTPLQFPPCSFYPGRNTNCFVCGAIWTEFWISQGGPRAPQPWGGGACFSSVPLKSIWFPWLLHYHLLCCIFWLVFVLGWGDCWVH